jgi:hypothetical protein
MFSGRSKIVNAREGQNAATLSGADIQAPMLQPKLANTASGSEKNLSWYALGNVESVYQNLS